MKINYIIVFLFVLIIPLVIIPLKPIEDITLENFDNSDDNNSQIPNLPKISSEEEEIDSFKVHPANRWNIQNNTNITNNITAGDYLVDFDTSSDSNFNMSRKLNTLDDKIITRYNTNVTETPQQEYFEDDLLDACDWVEDYDWVQTSRLDNVNLLNDRINADADGTASFCYFYWDNLTVNADLYENFQIRIRVNATDTSTLTFKIASWGLVMTDVIDIDVKNAFVTYNVSGNANWAGNNDVVLIYFKNTNDTYLDPNLGISIDYFKILTGEVILVDSFDHGLYDHNNEIISLRIVHHYFTSSIMQFQVYLYSDTGEIQASAFSSNYTCSNYYITTEIDFDVDKSDLTVRFLDDNAGLIDKLDYPSDFSIIDYSPDLFTKFYLSCFYRLKNYNFTVKTILKIDYVKAKFKIGEWEQIDYPSDNEWIADSWNTMTSFLFDVDDNSKYRMVISDLDAVNFIMMNLVCGEFGAGSLDIWNSTFRLYNVDKIDGTLDECVEATICRKHQVPQAAGVHIKYFELYLNEIQRITAPDSQTKINQDNSSLDFQVATINERSELNIKARYTPDVDTEYNRLFAYNLSLSDVNPDYSSEYVIEFEYVVDVTSIAGCGVRIVIDAFSFIRKDIFADIVSGITNLVDDLISGIVNIFSILLLPIFMFLAGLIATLFDVLGQLFISVIDSLTNAITILFDTLETVLDTLITSVIAVIDNVITAVGLIAADIIDFLVAAIEEIVDEIVIFLDVLITGLIAVLIDLIDLVYNFLVAAYRYLIAAVGIEDLLDALYLLFLDGFDIAIEIVLAILDALEFVFDVITVVGIFAIPLMWLYLLLSSIDESNSILEMLGTLATKLNKGILPDFAILGFELEVKVYFIMIPLTIVGVLIS